MSQKDYKLEIIEELIRNHNHIRGLAKKLKTNQTTIARKVKQLEKDNAVNFRQEGKNKVYFMKKTVEAQEYAYIKEHYKLLNTLKKYPSLKNIIQKIKANKNIKLAMLFGSYAKGTAHKESDIDIYIETTDRNLKKEIEIINTRLSIKIGRYIKDNILIKEIEKDHVIIKGIDEYYEKNKFFS